MAFDFWIDELVFSSMEAVRLSRAAIVVIVGPNNSGKTRCLREIHEHLEAQGGATEVSGGTVLRTVQTSRSGTIADLTSWLTETYGEVDRNGFFRCLHSATGARRDGAGQLRVPSNQMNQNLLPGVWPGDPKGSLGVLGVFLQSHIDVESRLHIVHPAKHLTPPNEEANHPIHKLYYDKSLELRLSGMVKEIVGNDLIVDPIAGGVIPLRFGDRPEPPAGGDFRDTAYAEKLRAVPPVEQQGDGVKSLVGCLLQTVVSGAKLRLIDEPEAFLHPPQAVALGRALAQALPDDTQFLLATHSGDLLRGLLTVAPERVMVVRLTRTGLTNEAKVLDATSVTALWTHPVLRFSGVLDAVFHQAAVLCEDTGDCSFYSTLLRDAQEASGTPLDLAYAGASGKDRLAPLVAALSAVGVPTAVIVDFDAIKGESPLRALVEAKGADWDTVEREWRVVNASVNEQAPRKSAEDVRAAVIEASSQPWTDEARLKEAKREFEEFFREANPWSAPKRSGTSAIPRGDASTAVVDLLASLAEIGIFVVPSGEMESFAPTIPGKGVAWVAAALQREADEGNTLARAREFVDAIRAHLVAQLAPASTERTSESTADA